MDGIIVITGAIRGRHETRYFKNRIRAIDETHVPAFVIASDYGNDFTPTNLVRSSNGMTNDRDDDELTKPNDIHSWKDFRDQLVMQEIIEVGYKIDGALKLTGLTVVMKFNIETGCSIEKHPVDNRMKTLLRQWVTKHHRIKAISSMGWDDVRKCFDASDDV
ncbi:hypothetical protein ACLOJK_028047 [Asimina triloba]